MELQLTKYKESVEKIFNNWTALRLAVEHGMGGRDSQKTALEIMNYMCDYCLQNPNIHHTELQEILEEIMDQEYDTICEDNSIPEISLNLVKYLKLCQEGKFSEVDAELSLLPSTRNWLRSDVSIINKNLTDSSSGSEDEGDAAESMDVDAAEPATSTTKADEVEVDPGWTLVKTKKK